MMALTLIKTVWRKKYGYYFFTFAIVLGVHTIPAAWTMGAAFNKYLFTLTCAWVITASLFGYRTLQFYDTYPVKHEKHILVEYSLITFGVFGAGFAEGFGVISKFIYKASHDAFDQYNVPDPSFGHSVYDHAPEPVGMTIFFAWAAVFWFQWPIKLLTIDTAIKKMDDTTTDGLLEIDSTIDASGTMTEGLLENYTNIDASKKTADTTTDGNDLVV